MQWRELLILPPMLTLHFCVKRWRQYAPCNFYLQYKYLLQTDALSFGADSQGDFLQALGIEARLEQALKQTEDEEEKKQLTDAVQYLIRDEHMGQRFKAFAIFPGVLKPAFDARGAPLGFSGARDVPIDY